MVLILVLKDALSTIFEVRVLVLESQVLVLILAVGSCQGFLSQVFQ